VSRAAKDLAGAPAGGEATLPLMNAGHALERHLELMVQTSGLDVVCEWLSQLPEDYQRMPVLARWRAALLDDHDDVAPACRTLGLSSTVKWLQAHASAHGGRWVALRHGVLLGSDVNRCALEERLSAARQLSGALFLSLAPARRAA
jgi:hypothetical protein